MKIDVAFLARTPLTPGAYKTPVRCTLPDGQTFESFVSIAVGFDGKAAVKPDAEEQGERLKEECEELIKAGKLRPINWNDYKEKND